MRSGSRRRASRKAPCAPGPWVVIRAPSSLPGSLAGGAGPVVHYVEVEVCHANESEAGRTVPRYRAYRPGRRAYEAIQPYGRLSHGRGFFARILLTEGSSPVGELRRGFT